MDNRAGELVAILKSKGLTVSTAESLTGGLIGASIVDISGASSVFNGGAITYTEKAKIEVLGVNPATVEKHTVVSEAVASEMALGARALYKSDIAISATGIAGPDGGSEEFPVGLVYIGVANQGGVRAYRYIFDGDRAAVRRQTVSKAIELMIAEAKKE